MNLTFCFTIFEQARIAHSSSCWDIYEKGDDTFQMLYKIKIHTFQDFFKKTVHNFIHKDGFISL